MECSYVSYTVTHLEDVSKEALNSSFEIASENKKVRANSFRSCEVFGGYFSCGEAQRGVLYASEQSKVQLSSSS